jgi:hypothetical protein
MQEYEPPILKKDDYSSSPSLFLSWITRFLATLSMPQYSFRVTILNSSNESDDSFLELSYDDQRLEIHFGSTDGVIWVALPLREPVYWRLTTLQSVMANTLDSNCSLSS